MATKIELVPECCPQHLHGNNKNERGQIQKECKHTGVNVE